MYLYAQDCTEKKIFLKHGSYKTFKISLDPLCIHIELEVYGPYYGPYGP